MEKKHVFLQCKSWTESFDLKSDQSYLEGYGFPAVYVDGMYCDFTDLIKLNSLGKLSFGVVSITYLLIQIFSNKKAKP